MTEQQLHLDPRRVERTWLRMRAGVDAMIERAQEPTQWDVKRGSLLASDDAKVAPWQTSHAVSISLASAVDHLHSLMVTVFDAGALHTYAPYTLVRGSLETASTGLWLLSPPAQTDRLTRTLKWHAANINDSDAACRAAGIQMPRTRDERRADLRATAERNGCPLDQALNPMTATSVVREADELVPGIAVLFAWQLCSGFAHGRPWASIGLFEDDTRPSGEEGVLHMRQENSLERLLWPTLAAYRVLRAARRKFEDRGSR